MYVGPDKILRVVDELVRVARIKVILNEWHSFHVSPDGLSLWHFAHWVHDYERIFAGRREVRTLQIDRLPRGLWDAGGGWDSFGALIQVEIGR